MICTTCVLRTLHRPPSSQYATQVEAIIRKAKQDAEKAPDAAAPLPSVGTGVTTIGFGTAPSAVAPTTGDGDGHGVTTIGFGAPSTVVAPSASAADGSAPGVTTIGFGHAQGMHSGIGSAPQQRSLGALPGSAPLMAMRDNASSSAASASTTVLQPRKKLRTEA